MSIFTAYELGVLDVLVAPYLGASTVDAIAREARLVNYDYCTGEGYFLTVAHPSVPSKRTVCSEPMVTARVNEALCGFVVFLERGELTFECYTFGSGDVPENIRDLDITIDPQMKHQQRDGAESPNRRLSLPITLLVMFPSCLIFGLLASRLLPLTSTLSILFVAVVSGRVASYVVNLVRPPYETCSHHWRAFYDFLLRRVSPPD